VSLVGDILYFRREAFITFKENRNFYTTHLVFNVPLSVIQFEFLKAI